MSLLKYISPACLCTEKNNFCKQTSIHAAPHINITSKKKKEEEIPITAAVTFDGAMKVIV